MDASDVAIRHKCYCSTTIETVNDSLVKKSPGASGDFVRVKKAKFLKPTQGLTRSVSKSTNKRTGKILQYK